MKQPSVGTRLMRSAYQLGLRPVLFRLHGGDPERIHEDMVHLLSRLPVGARGRVADPVTVAGIRFPNRVGLAAGMDKDGLAAAAWARLGFGFAELGTVTGRPQPGNPLPRVFRLRASKAIINRMGFNNAGADAMAAHLHRLGVRRGNNAVGIPLGISIGKTKLVALDHAVDDYLHSLRTLHPYADYFAVNVSSPNTPGLRSLQGAEELAALLAALVGEARTLSGRPTPILVKLAPDLDAAQLRETLAVIDDSGAAGIIATNTTLSRAGLAAPDRALAQEAGGLSGAPLTERSLRFVERVAAGSRLPVVGVGGIMAPCDAARMFDAGAQLVQLYTGFIYSGTALVRGIRELEGR
ncbi:quinone-dependent dihydroorotate dehydrogenase [Tessaracoccus sp. OS52]|uniref:quinone-dependent dihydroorotate dehydrogenase n=1 Tax=Tessaracoccus sp. OS52 TaxID=2886691 RepID=UPI001D1292FB|nr:quinone-dependent dihydroorotate dehydrogenase [Tessaracoccus sp. OS52]MCC2592960.1 quinone-dependent dihydroorotate dehydrogenase [Tessaracoccus sp. OS52]